MRIRTLPGTLAFLFAASLSAQKGGGVTGSPGTTPPTGTVSPPTVPSNPGISGNSAPRTPELPRPIFISGKVVMQDGSPVPSDVTIQRVCSGATHTVAYTDSKGRFSFDLNDRNSIVGDASDSGSNRNLGASSGLGGSQSMSGSGMNSDLFSNRMMNCELRANLAGYTSDMVNLLNRRVSDGPDIGIIVLHRIPGVEGTSVSATALMAPKDAKKAYEHGLQTLAKNKPDEAAKDFEKAVSVYPKYADAWVSLGRIRLQARAADQARTAFAKAIECDPKLVTAYMELGILSARESKWEESGNYLEQALKLDPVDFPQAWYTSAVANYNLKKYDAAEKSAREALRLDPRHVNPRSDYLLGLILAEKQDYNGASDQLRRYLKLVPNAPDLTVVQDQLGQLEKLKADNGSTPVAGQPR